MVAVAVSKTAAATAEVRTTRVELAAVIGPLDSKSKKDTFYGQERYVFI